MGDEKKESTEGEAKFGDELQEPIEKLVNVLKAHEDKDHGGKRCDDARIRTAAIVYTLCQLGIEDLGFVAAEALSLRSQLNLAKILNVLDINEPIGLVVKGSKERGS